MADKVIEDKVNKVSVDTAVEGWTGSIDFNTLKSGGLIKQKQKDMFTVRLRCPGGRVPLDKLAKVVEVARKYVGDYVHLSFRQSIELPYVDYRNFKAVHEELAEADQLVASCGARVRVGGRHGRHPIVGHTIAEFVSDEQLPVVIEAILQWYADHGAEFGRTRIGVILQIPEKWQSFVGTLRRTIPRELCEASVPPTPNEIHFT